MPRVSLNSSDFVFFAEGRNFPALFDIMLLPPFSCWRRAGLHLTDFALFWSIL